MSDTNGANGGGVYISLGSATHNRTTDAEFLSVIADISNGRWHDEVAAIREAYGVSRDAGDDLKRKLPAILWSGTFSKRTADALKKHSGLVHVDLDKLGSSLEAWREHIWQDPHTLYCMTSPSGTGLKVVYRCDPARPHIESFHAAEFHVLQAFGLVADPACKDVNRLCFVSDDPEAFFNKDALPLPYPPEPIEQVENAPEKTARRSYSLDRISPGDDYDQRGDWKAVLAKHRWTAVGEIDWRRPDKTIGISARWDSTPNHPLRLYVWTSSAPPFKAGGLYKPWHIYGLLECGGDFDLAAEQLYQLNYGSRRRVPDGPDQATQAQLDAEEEARGANGTSNHSHLMPGDRYLDDGGHVSAVPDPTKSPLPEGWPAPISAADLCAKPPPKPEVLVEGILYAGGTMLVAGPSKSMKTFSALDVAIAIASGGKWMGRQCVKAPVLYLNLELQDFATEERIAKICSARGIEPPANLHVWNLRGKTVTMAVLARCLPYFITLHGCKIACIDPHYKVSSVSDMEENSNDSQGKLLTLLEGLCAQAGAALAITHHFAKGDAGAKNAIDRASGGGVFARWGDVMMTFTPHEEGDAMTVEMALRNFAPVKPFVVRWEYPRWVRDDSLDPAKLKKKPGTFQEQFSAADLLLALGDQLLTNSEWEKKSKMSRTTYYKKRSELLESKRVEQVGSCYRKC